MNHLRPPSLVPLNVERQRELNSHRSTGDRLQLQLPLQIHLKLRPLPLPMPPPTGEPLIALASESAPPAALRKVRSDESPGGLMALTWREAKRILLLSSMVPPVDRRQGPPTSDLPVPASELGKKRRSAESTGQHQVKPQAAQPATTTLPTRSDLHEERRQRHSSQLQVSSCSFLACASIQDAKLN